MVQLFEDILPPALQSGVSISEYWYLTYGEIKATIDAHQANQKLHTREQASQNHSLANLIGLSVARLINDEAEYPSLKEAYPGIFSDIVDEPVQQDWRLAKARLLQYAEANNKKRGDYHNS